ncbi:DUF2125 domain-containing protein [Phenylobacterium deserti]|uniref:DUF2125 domain-containing protein n=1 Tax=Phenylobacterium deserti TaxID=1914756 RepID=A0A328AU16_9CAUL|nr:DUF2125 domain-containing protein [Phenylobacterium deserti]RAK58107.1 hypothetical protein DJ018_09425 [Phenylobacterium deserti]
MSVHDPEAPRKPRRLFLYLPFVLALILAIAWSGVWFWARGEAQTRMDAAVAQLNEAGYRITWAERSIGGFPFRMDVTLRDARVAEPSGWALQAPVLEGEAYLISPTSWMLAAPQGLTFVRPVGGPVTVTGRVIRTSLTHLDSHPPSVSFQGLDLAFRPGPGAQPFALSAAQKVEIHLRAGPDDEGGVFARVDQGKARLSGLFARIAGDKPVDMVWNATLSKISAFKGDNWPDAVRNWVAAGGQMSVRQAGVTAGEALIGANSGTLSVGRDGRVTGVLNVSLKQAPRALGAMGEMEVIPPERANAAAAVAAARQGASDTAQATLTFQAGMTTLGPIAIAPAPKVYQAP